MDASDQENFWTPDDARSLLSFLNSYTGKKLKIRLTNFTTKMAIAAVQNPNCSPYMNGQASGVAACVAAIEAHTPQQREENESSETLDAMEAARV